MKNYKVKHLIFRIMLYIIALLILLTSVQKFSLIDANNAIIFSVTLVSCIVMGMMIINAGGTYIELTDAILVFLISHFNKEVTVVFCVIYYMINGLMSERYVVHQRDRSKKYFNTAMFTVVTYVSGYVYERFFSTYLDHMGNSFINAMLTSVIMVGTFLIVNIIIIKIEYSLSMGKYFKLQKESITLLIINYMVSTMIATTILIINGPQANVLGLVLVIGNLIVLHYCFYIYRKLQVRSEAIKGLLKITSDIVKYGDFRDKCKHLIISLKELIPYNICAVYTFDDKADIAFPIAYNGPENIDIGEMALDMSSEAVTVKTVKEGKIYISRDIRRDKKVKIIGKLADTCDAMIFVPILIEEKVRGLIMLGGGEEFMNFTNNGMNDTLNILSNQMALAIENDSFYRDIKNRADSDALTRLYNRSVLEREINSLLSNKAQFSLVMYDIDDFKNINDSYGHLAGDEVLKMIADIIKRSIRKTDVPCRYGGEEIVIIFKDLSKEDALIISERIREKIESSSLQFDDNDIRITISGGVSSYPEDGDTREDIIGTADKILYMECKQRGKNKVSAFNLRVKKGVSLDKSYEANSF